MIATANNADEDLKTWGVRLREAREVRGLGVIEAADRIGTSPRHLSSWERGEATPTRWQLARIYNLVNKSLRQHEHLLPLYVRNPAEARKQTLTASLGDLAKVKKEPAKPPEVGVVREITIPAANEPERPPPCTAKQFPEALRTLRKAAGLQVKELAALLEVTDGAIDHYEGGRARPSQGTYDKLKELFPQLPALEGLKGFKVKPGKKTKPPEPPKEAPKPAVKDYASLGAAYGRALKDVEDAEAAVEALRVELQTFMKAYETRESAAEARVVKAREAAKAAEALLRG